MERHVGHLRADVAFLAFVQLSLLTHSSRAVDSATKPMIVLFIQSPPPLSTSRPREIPDAVPRQSFTQAQAGITAPAHAPPPTGLIFSVVGEAKSAAAPC